MDEIVDNIDIEAILSKIDIGTLVSSVVKEVDLGGIIRESTEGVTAEAVDAVRSQTVKTDVFVSRIVDRVLLRKTPRDLELGPSLTLDGATGRPRLMSRERIRNARARAMQGQRAGFVTRCLACAVDVGIVFVLYTAVLFGSARHRVPRDVEAAPAAQPGHLDPHRAGRRRRARVPRHELGEHRADDRRPGVRPLRRHRAAVS